MAVKITNMRMRVKQSKVTPNKTRELERYLWSGIKGLWKDKKIDAVAYQREIRREADSVNL